MPTGDRNNRFENYGDWLVSEWVYQLEIMAVTTRKAIFHVWMAPDVVIKTNIGEIGECSGSLTHVSVRNE